MLTQPADLPTAAVVVSIAAGWDIRVTSAEYLPVGFGSHHWRADAADGSRWFVTVDDLRERRFETAERPATTFARIRSGLCVARALADGGRSFVVAPVPDRDGPVLRRLGAHWAVAVYPFVDGQSGRWGHHDRPTDRRELLELLLDVHSAPAAVTRHAQRDDFRIAERDDLERALRDLRNAGTAGPHADTLRTALTRHRDALRRALDHHDRRAATANRQPEMFVLTHGEPHAGNAVRTADGWRIVDWDTALLAPPERDLWILADGDPSILAAYEERTGRRPDADLLDHYRGTWRLTDIATFAAHLRRPHTATADSDKALAGVLAALASLEGLSRRRATRRRGSPFA